MITSLCKSMVKSRQTKDGWTEGQTDLYNHRVAFVTD